MGFSNKLILNCCSCKWNIDLFTSYQTSHSASKQGRNMFDVNVRSVVAFREIGRGHDHISNYACCMNMLGISEPAFRNIHDALLNAYKQIANTSMQKACQEISENSEKLKTVGVVS